MSILVAKKYVKALMTNCEVSNVTQINNQLKQIASAYTNNKFNEIIDSIDVSTQDKTNLINSFIDDANVSVTNLIKLLGKNKRLNIIPDISKELNKQSSILNNDFEGFVYSNEKLSDDYMLRLKNNFVNKFSCTLTLENIVNDYDGIKVDIDGLGIEISFANKQFKSQIIEHILKAV